MAKTFTIPAIFTAIDKMSGPISAMQNNMATFAQKSEAGIARSERLFRKLTPALGEASKQFLSFASTAAIAGGIVGGVSFSVESLKDYETAVASFRTIVGGTDAEFSKYQAAINSVAKDTKKSTIDTAAAFEKIAGLNAKFAETADSISAVSKAAITLSKASGDELGASAESLVGIMNQFNLSANQADRTINVLAAGAGVGAASIVQTSEAFVNFGSVAKGANISLEQSVGLVQTLGKFSIFGAEAGTKLRGSVLKLQQAGLGYKSGQFEINDALEEASKKIEKLKTSKEKDAAILKMFGAENIATGKILLSNIDTFKEYTKGVTGTSAAQEQANIRSNTLANKLDELKAAWINMITGSDGASNALNTVKGAIGFVIDNLDTIVSVGSKVIMVFAAWKAWIMISKAAMIGYNVVLGINSALTGTSSLAMQGNVVALGAQRVALGLATASQWSLNAAMSANPIGVVVIAVAALVAAIMTLREKYNALMADIEGRQRKGFRQEVSNVTKLADSYKGMSRQAALEKAVNVEKANVIKEREGIKQEFAKTNFWEYSKREELLKRAKENDARMAALNEKGLINRFANLNEGERAKIISPTTDAQMTAAQNVTSTNNAEVLIKVDAPAGTEAKSDNKSVSVVPVVGSTMPKR